MERLIPSRAPFGRRLAVVGGRPVAAGIAGPFGLLDPFPLPGHVGRGGGRRVSEDVRMATDDLPGDRCLDVGQVEDPRLGGQLSVEDDLEEQVAELLGELGRGAGLERVVDLVCLLEEVLPQRLVGLLPVPWAAIGKSKSMADVGHGPRTRLGPLGCEGREVQRPGEVGLGQRVDRGVGGPGAADPMIRRVEAPEHVERALGAAPMPPRKGRYRLRNSHRPSHAAGAMRTGRDASIGVATRVSATTT